MSFYKNVLRPIMIAIVIGIFPTILFIAGASANYPEWFNGLAGITIGVFCLMLGFLINLKISENE